LRSNGTRGELRRTHGSAGVGLERGETKKPMGGEVGLGGNTEITERKTIFGRFTS